MLFSISKQSFPKLPNQLIMPMTGVISGGSSFPKIRQSQTPFLEKKSGSYQNLW